MSKDKYGKFNSEPTKYPPEIKMTVKGNCGQIHTFEEWQKCEACASAIRSATIRVEDGRDSDIWNAAIEAAAIEAKKYLNSVGYKGINTEAAIRKLKR